MGQIQLGVIIYLLSLSCSTKLITWKIGLVIVWKRDSVGWVVKSITQLEFILIFTHEFENGERAAIILMDTQGLFNNESTMNDCISIFAISMLRSSIQCYNLMRNVEENNLQHLQLFTQYAQLVMKELMIMATVKSLLTIIWLKMTSKLSTCEN